MTTLKLTVNGKTHDLDVPESRTLAEVLRYDLDLTGTKIACEEAECGACTVLVNGTPVDSCIYPGFKAQDRQITTIEGLADGESLHPLQSAFIEHGVVFFRDQHLTPEEHIAFAERWGEINVNRFFQPVASHPLIAEVRKEPDQTLNIGGGWHTDHSYDQIPALGSVLYAREVPPVGGDTLFASMALAYQSLDELSTDLYTLGPDLTTRLFNNFPEFAPTFPRQLLWFFGGDCLHYMPDEELAQFQQLEDMRLAAASRGETFKFEESRARLLNLH